MFNERYLLQTKKKMHCPILCISGFPLNVTYNSLTPGSLQPGQMFSIIRKSRPSAMFPMTKHPGKCTNRTYLCCNQDIRAPAMSAMPKHPREVYNSDRFRAVTRISGLPQSFQCQNIRDHSRKLTQVR